LGTWREHVGNKGKMKKFLHNPTSPKLKRKINSRHFECMLSLPIGWVKFVFRHHFWPGPIPLWLRNVSGFILLVWTRSK
jgi:hypothetical protein